MRNSIRDPAGLDGTSKGSGRYPAIVSILTALAVFLSPYLVLRPARTQSGTGRYLATGFGREALFLAALFLLPVLALLLRRSRIAEAMRQSVVLIPAALLAVAGLAALRLASGLPSAARVSPGPGFWIALGIFFSASAVSGQESLARRSLILAIAALPVLAIAGVLKDVSLAREFASRKDMFLGEFLRHAAYAAGSVAAAAVIALPLGYAASRSRKVGAPLFAFAGLAQAIPTLSLLGFMMLPLGALGEAIPTLGAAGVRGTGWAPASIALFLYAILPVAANARAGFRAAGAEVLDAAKGLGMGRMDIFMRVEFPLALPSLTAGVRTALTQNIGNAVIAGLVGGGGLGSIIFLGLAQSAPDLILLGALPLVALAWAADRGMQALSGMASVRASGIHGFRNSGVETVKSAGSHD